MQSSRRVHKYISVQNRSSQHTHPLVSNQETPPPPPKMKSFIVLALFVAAAVAVPVDPKDATIVRYDNDNIGVEGFNFAYETSDGKSASESGQLKNVGSENEALEVRGQFAYLGTDGVQYAVSYVANEFGFQPSGAHLPKAPVV